MHEMSLAEGVLQLVEDTARSEGAARVKTVVLEIGRLSSVEPEALRFCFEAVARGSLAEGAALEIIDLPGAGLCLACGATVALEEIYGACPGCGGHQVQATAGTEMRVKEIEIE
jgi:hydrogenase nickel incorporation protein HypA/HybF